ncbi:MAG: hypothetical protein KF773_25025 [Deltaproteobacteria bacterium]|nr:hypothetical protein [Deltaproteobacteria bacterium]
MLAPGTYSQDSQTVLNVSPFTTAALSIVVHGGGAIVADTTDGQPLIEIELPTTIRDLEVRATGLFGIGLRASNVAILERVKVSGRIGIVAQSSMTIRELSSTATEIGIDIAGGALVLDRATISGGENGIHASSGSINISNVLIFGTSKAGIDLTTGSLVSGSIDSVTVTDTGLGATSGAAGLTCSGLITVRSSIVWTPGAARPAAVGCNSFTATIVGPSGAVGAMNVNPRFVDPAARDYHLLQDSPAKDAVDVGPPLDIDGDQRPRGPRFDIGADEAP